MQKIYYKLLIGLFTFIFLQTSSVAFAQISESFETGLPTAYTATTSYTLGSGVWTGQANGVIKGATGITTGAASLQLRSQTGAQITSPNITTGVSTVKFYGSASTTTGSVQVNYSTDGGTTWQQATGSPFALTTGAPVQFTATINQNVPSILVQFYRTNSTVYIDDVDIAIASTSPYLFTNPTSITGLNYLLGAGPSAASSNVSISGGNLTGSITVAVPANFEVSGDGGTTWSTTSYVNATVPFNVKFRLVAGLGTGSYTGNAVVSSTGATSMNVSLAGSVTLTAASTCLAQGFEAASPWPPTGWLQTTVTRSTLAADVAVGTAAAVFGSNNGSMTTPALANPQSISFYLGRTNNTTAKTFNVQVSTTSQTAGFTTIATFTHANVPTSSYNQYTVDLSAYTGNAQVWVKFEKVSSTTSPWRFDEVSATCGQLSPCTEPTAQPTAFVANNPGGIGGLTSGSIKATFTAASPVPSHYLVLASPSSSLSALPVDGTLYSIGDAIGNATVVDNDGNTSINATSLDPGVEYFFYIFSYNKTNCSGANYLTTNPLTGSQTTRPAPPSNFRVVCQSANSAVLEWVNPSSAYDGVIILGRNSAAIPNLPEATVFPSAITANANFASGTVVSAAAPPTYALYKGTGTTFTVTGLTTGQPYTFLAVGYKNSVYSSTTTPTASIASLGQADVSNLNGAPSLGQVILSWSNPNAGCYQEILVVANPGAFVPSGDGSAYTANSVYSAAGQVVYKGVGNGVTVTGLPIGNHCFKVWVRNGTNWSLGISKCFNINDFTIFKAGELFFTGFDPQYLGSGVNDEYLLATLVDIKPGTSFKIVNSRYEAGAAANVRTEKWGGAGDIAEEMPSYVDITWIGPGNLPLGSVIHILNNSITNAADFVIDASDYAGNIYDQSKFSYSSPVGFFPPNLSTSSYDQFYVVQGNFYDDGTPGTVGEANYYLNGRVLFGITIGVNWVPLNTANSGGQLAANRTSRLPAEISCFNFSNTASTNLKYSAYYRNSSLHIGNKRSLITEVANTNPTNGKWYYGTGHLNVANPSAASNEAGAAFNVTQNVPDGSWFGDKNTNWFDCGNWGGLAVPDETVDVILDPAIAAITNNAQVSNTATYAVQYGNVAKAKSLTINATGKSVSILSSTLDVLNVTGNINLQAGTLLGGSGLITLGGDWLSNGGSFTPQTGTVNFNGYAGQNIGSATFNNLTFSNFGTRTGPPNGTITINGNLTGQHSTSFVHNNSTVEMLGSTATSYSATNPFTFYNFKQGNTAGLTIGSTMSVLNEFGTGSGAKINVNNDITLKSTASLTAFASNIPSNATFTYGSSGRFVVERYLGMYRKWQLLSPNTFDQTFWQSWQENGAATTGYGTKITFPGGGSGMDGASFSPSLKFYNPSTDDYTGVANTNQSFTLKPGYFIFDYGDRNGGTLTTLRSRGKLYSNNGSGNQTITVQTIPAGLWDVLGNPYASRLNISTFLTANPGLQQSVRVWDAKLGGAYSSGAYQTITSGGVVTPGGSGYYNGTENFIESGQAFFVKSNAGAVNISFNENQKSAGSRLVMKPAKEETMFSVMLYRNDELMDGVRLLLDNGYSNEIDLMDAEKRLNNSANLGMLKNGKQLAVEFRKPFIASDTVQLNIGNIVSDKYRFGFSVQNFNGSLLNAYLVDKFTNKHYEINLADSSFQEFSLTADAAYSSADRFMVVFQRKETGKIINFTAIRNKITDQVKFSLNNELGVQNYQVEGSADGENFELVKELDAIGMLNYSATQNVVPTLTKWYRVRLNYVDGTFAFSESVKVSGTSNQQIFLAENPVKNGLVNMVFQNMVPKKYPIQITNAMGQVVYKDNVVVNGKYETKQIKVKSLLPGTYALQVGETVVRFVVE